MIEFYRELNYKKKVAVAYLTCAAVSLFILYFINPTETIVFIPCYFHALTGLYCPACGGLRATHYLLHGKFYEALDANLLIVIFIPILIYLLFYNFTLFVFNKETPKIPTGKFAITLGFVILLTFGILRNLDGHPWRMLAP